MTTSARALVPTAITAAMLGAGTTLAEPHTASGEVAWVSGGSYVVDDERTYSGSVYTCVKAHAGSATLPSADAINWLRKGPTLRMAPFDDYAATTAVTTTTLTYVINPGFVDGVNLYRATGDAYTITVKDAPGGTTIASKTGDLYAQATGLWELAFAPLARVDGVALGDIPISPTAEVTITITAASGQPVAVGDIKVGGWRILKGSAQDFGGAQYGASSERKTYTTRTTNPDGTYKTTLRSSTRDVVCSVVLDSAQALYADAVLGEVQNTAVPFEATSGLDYGYLSTLGFLSGKLTASTYATAQLDITIQGVI